MGFLDLNESQRSLVIKLSSDDFEKNDAWVCRS